LHDGVALDNCCVWFDLVWLRFLGVFQINARAIPEDVTARERMLAARSGWAMAIRDPIVMRGALR